jgi:hypothetical protein
MADEATPEVAVDEPPRRRRRKKEGDGRRTNYVIFRAVEEDATGREDFAWVRYTEQSATSGRQAVDKATKNGEDGITEGTFWPVPARYVKAYRTREKVTREVEIEEV